MTDYLTTQYNATMAAIQDGEAKALAGGLAIYADAVRHITEDAAQKRMEAGIADAAARAQRDHEYHNGRIEPTAPVEPEAQREPDREDPDYKHVEKMISDRIFLVGE